MYLHQDWFFTYHSIDDDIMLIEKNNMSCKVVGIGTISINMHNGIIRTLPNMQHILDLRKNLIYLSILGSHDFKYSSKDKILNVLKDALIILKDRLSHGLDTLQGSIVVRATSIFSSYPNLDSTHLWYMHLDHMSKASISLLTKQDLLYGQKIEKLEFYDYGVYGKQYKISNQQDKGCCPVS